MVKKKKAAARRVSVSKDYRCSFVTEVRRGGQSAKRRRRKRDAQNLDGVVDDVREFPNPSCRFQYSRREAAISRVDARLEGECTGEVESEDYEIFATIAAARWNQRTEQEKKENDAL